MRSPIFAFFSPPSSPVTPTRPSSTRTESTGPNVALFTHQDGKKFEVSIVRLNHESATDPEPELFEDSDWDSDDWDEDAEDWEEPTPPPPPRQYRELAVAADDWSADVSFAPSQDRRRTVVEEVGADHRRVRDWDGEAEDLEEPPVAALAQRPERPDWVRRHGDADVWRTRLGED